MNAAFMPLQWYNRLMASAPARFGLVCCAALTLLLTACGQVITRPTTAPTATATATATVPARVVVEPTATLRFIPPTATPTPTITPTPVVYRIQPGDNLYIIANKYGVDHDLLRDVNEITNERALQVGQQLFIPVQGAVDAPRPTPTVTPTPLPASVQGVSFFPSPLGELTVLGEVRNDGDIPLERVQVRITLFDAADRLLDSVTAFTALPVLLPGEPAPFAVRFAEQPSQLASYQAELLSAVPAYLGTMHLDLKPFVMTAEQTSGNLARLHGRVVNTGQADAGETLVVATAYDALGRVIGLRAITLEPALVANGGEAPFTVDVLLAAPQARYHVTAQARRLSPPE